MLIAEIINEIKDIDKNTVYFYDRMGYINPKRVKTGKVERRIYSYDDFEKIKAIWKYHKQGYSPRAAFKKASKELKQKEKNLDEELKQLFQVAEKKGIEFEAALLKTPDLLSKPGVKRDIAKILRELVKEEE